MIKIGLDLGIFKVLASASGTKTVDEIAQETGANPQLMSANLLISSFFVSPILTFS